jgi:hypothetical protein
VGEGMSGMKRKVRCPYCEGEGGRASPMDGEWSECMQCSETGVMTVEQVRRADASFSAYDQDGWNEKAYYAALEKPVPAWIIALPDAKPRQRAAEVPE